MAVRLSITPAATAKTKEAPLLYAKLALKEKGLQDYVDAMNEFN